MQQFYISVDCEWDEWIVGKCSATCGGGTRTNTRTKTVAEMYGGKCEGTTTTTESCNTDACPGKGISNII